MDPITIITGISVAWNIFQSIRKKQYKETIGAVVDGVELASRSGVISPKAAITSAAAAKGVSNILNDVLDKKRYRKRIASRE